MVRLYLSWVIDIRLGNEIIPTRFIVSNNVAEPMLGSDWLRNNEITWDFCNDSLSWKNKTFMLITGIEAKCAIRATRRRRCIINNWRPIRTGWMWGKKQPPRGAPRAARFLNCVYAVQTDVEQTCCRVISYPLVSEFF